METIFLLVLPTMLGLVSFALTIRSRQRGALVVGRVIESSRTGVLWRNLSTALLVIIAGCALVWSEANLVPFLPMMAVGLLINVLRPREFDRVTGTEGVRAGWNARRYEELEEWRITGDHLRFKLFDQWTAVPLSVDAQAPIHARLLECAPERESSFNQ